MNTIEMQKVKLKISEMNIEELRNIAQYVNLLYKMEISKAAKSFTRGDSVSFTLKDGTPMFGVVMKVNQKSVSVNTSRGNWKVAGSLLTLVE